MEQLHFPAEKFIECYQLDISRFVENKQGFDYLSWSYAVRFLAEHFPGIQVRFKEDDLDPPRPFTSLGDGKGAYVSPYLTDGVKRTSHLFYPVIDYRNKPIPDPNAMEVNTARMRGAVKAIAMYTGLGLSLYTGEDLPVDELKAKAVARILQLQKEKGIADPLTEKQLNLLPYDELVVVGKHLAAK